MTEPINLFTPLKMGRFTLSNRLIMASMTRNRAEDDGTPGNLMPQYYAQRASAGLIITEGTYPSPLGKGYLHIPGIHTASHINGWRKVTDAVHAQGGKIFLQLMHCGRISDPSFLPDNATPIAPSVIRPSGYAFTERGPVPYAVPRMIETGEISQTIDDYRYAAKYALEAGFDGVELHAASGYLPEQFLSSGTNHRADQYGGSIENRARFILEVLEALTNVVGSDRTGIKIAPEMGFNDVSDSTPLETYSYLVKELSPLRLAYLQVALFNTQTDYHGILRPLFDGCYFAGAGYDKTSAEDALQAEVADAIVFGRLFLANPDLPERFRINALLNKPDAHTFYSQGPKGYIDYPTLAPT